MAYVCISKITAQATFANDIIYIYTNRKYHWKVLLEIIIINPRVRTPADAQNRFHILMHVFEFLNQMLAWFLKIDPVQMVGMRGCMCVCVCVRAQGY